MQALLLLAVLAQAQFTVKFIGEGGGSNPSTESNNALHLAGDGPTGEPQIQRIKKSDKQEESRSLTAEEPESPLSSREFDGSSQRPELRHQRPEGSAADLSAQILSYEGISAAPTVSGPQVGEVFVAVDLDLTGRPDRDAVSDLARSAAFRPDGRFPPQLRGKDRMSVSGWMPPGRVADAFRVRGVSRVQMEPAARRPAHEGAVAAFSVTVRVPAGTDPRAVAASLQSDLAATGLKLDNEFIDRRETAVLKAELPLRSMSRLLEHSAVLKAVPYEAPPAAPRPIEATPIAVPQEGFLGFAASNAPALLAVTLLLLIPHVARGIKFLAEIFIPYQK